MMWDGWWWVFGGVPMILLWIGIIVLIVWIVIKIAKSSGTESKSNALDIAKERYAKGEISKEEFDQIKKDIV